VTRELLSGNEAIARGAWEAGAHFGAGYPGTPSTEVLEAFAAMPDVTAEWAPNEKVALEVGAGASLGGRRALVTMKHVGLNVAADPLFTLAYTGVGGGLVIVVADDPGMYSSQNEQDSRNYAAFARVPVLEPSDSQEALDFTRSAFEISEAFDTPVLLRSTTRVSHGTCLVQTGEPTRRPEKPPYEKDVAKWVMMPANARCRRVGLEERLEKLAAHVETCPENRVEKRGSDLGIVTSGVAYHYVREALPEASILKLGSTFPFPEGLVRDFASGVERVAVVEELDPYLTSRVRGAGVSIEDIAIPRIGELSPGRVAAAFGIPAPPQREPLEGLPPRPPLLCPGCPHRGVFHALRKLKAVVTGDIGCYTLAALPPLASMDTCVCMGASIGMAHGLSASGGSDGRPVVAVIGDSTFAHSGITALTHLAFNGGAATVVVLDNRTTAMTGQQGNPVSGRRLQGDAVSCIDIEALARALGVPRVRTLDPHDLLGTEEALREEISSGEASLVIARSPCALLIREREHPYAIDEEACTACGACLKLGCPALSKETDGKAAIDTDLCVGCRDCLQVCRYDAIVTSGPACDLGGV